MERERERARRFGRGGRKRIVSRRKISSRIESSRIARIAASINPSFLSRDIICLPRKFPAEAEDTIELHELRRTKGRIDAVLIRPVLLIR